MIRSRSSKALAGSALALALLPGCNVMVVGVLTAPKAAPSSTVIAGRMPAVFSLAPAPEGGLVQALPPPAVAPEDGAFEGPAPEVRVPEVRDAQGAIGSAAAAAMNSVRLSGRASLGNPGARMANVRDGLVIGTPVTVLDAKTGKHMGDAVTFYDGSYALDVRFKGSYQEVIVSTTVLDAADKDEKVVLSNLAVLRAGEAERRLSITPGTTALAAFLQAIAALKADRPAGSDDVLEVEDELAAVPSPRLGALLTALREDQRETMMLLADSSKPLQDAASVEALREAVRDFVGSRGDKAR